MDEMNTNVAVEEVEVEEVAEVFDTSIENANVVDRPLDQVVAELNLLSEALCQIYGMPAVGITVDGNTTRIKFQRLRGGYAIEVGLKALQVSKAKFMARLIHELVHVYHDMEYIVDTCGNGAYHTDVFAAKAKEFGLVTQWNRSYGFAGAVQVTKKFVSQFNDDFELGLNDFIVPTNTAISFAKPKVVREPKARKEGAGGGFKAKIYKVVCPICNEVFYVQKDQVVTEEAFIAQNTPKPKAVAAEAAVDVAGEDMLG